MRRWLRSIVDVRRGEVTLTLLMFFYYYLLLVTYYFLKPARDSLFLVKLGAEQLPIVFILIALIVVPVTTVYSRAGRSLRLNRLINLTTVVLIVNLVLLRFLLEFTHPSVFYIFYIWVSIYGALSTSQFWLLANAVFDAAQAKRLFVFFGLGGIVGAFTGGEVTSLVVRTFDVSTENLVFFCMVFLGGCILLVNIVWMVKDAPDVSTPAASRKRRESKESYAEIFRTIKRSRHLLLIVGIIAATMATASFVDYQFKTISVDSFPTKQNLTSFLGKFYGRLSLISFLFQLFISYRVLRLFGVGGAILLLPLALLGGSISMLLVPGLFSAVLIRGADGVFKYSIDKTGRELLFLPVPLEVKKRTKIFIDIFVDRWFRGFAGLVLLLFVGVLQFSVRHLSIAVMVLIAIWLLMAFRMRKEYVNAFRKALERREIDLEELRINIADASTLETLKHALESKNERQIVYALDMLTGFQDSKFNDVIRPLLNHSSADVRSKAITVLRLSDDDSFMAEMNGLLEDSDPRVRREAMHYLCDVGETDRTSVLERFLQERNVTTRSAAIGCIGEHGQPEEQRLVDETVIEGLMSESGPEGEFARAQLAEALGGINRPSLKGYLVRLLDDPSQAVVDGALQSAGQLRDRELVPKLIKYLGNTRHRKGAREALAAYGDHIVGTLGDYIADTSFDITTRSNLCRVLSRVPTQHSVDTLIATLDQVDPDLGYHVLKALNALRAKYPELTFRHDALSGALLRETKSYYAILQILHVHGGADDDAAMLLRKALKEKLDQNVERIFRLLGLTYSQKDIYAAYLGFVGGKKELKANAVEFLDNVLRKDVKKYLFPIVDSISVNLRIRKGRELFGTSISSWDPAIKYLIEGRDPWLKACAIFVLRNSDSDDLRAMARQMLNDPHPVVKETARLVLSQT